MKTIGGLVRTKAKYNDGWCFRSGHAGGDFKDAFGVMIRHRDVLDCMVEDEYGGYEFGGRCLFDIMVSPLTRKQWAVFIADIFDPNSDVFMIRLAD